MLIDLSIFIDLINKGSVHLDFCPMWNTSVNDNLLISEKSSRKTEIARHLVMECIKENLKSCHRFFFLLVANDLGLAWAAIGIVPAKKKFQMYFTRIIMFNPFKKRNR